MVKLKLLKKGDYTELSKWAQCSHKGLQREIQEAFREGDIKSTEAETENQRSHAACLADGGRGAKASGARPSTSWKGKEMDSSDVQEGIQDQQFFFLT